VERGVSGMFMILLQYLYESLGTGGKHKTPQDGRSYGPDSKQCSYITYGQSRSDSTQLCEPFLAQTVKEKPSFWSFLRFTMVNIFMQNIHDERFAHRSFLRWWINVYNAHAYASEVLWTFYFPRRVKPMLSDRMNELNTDHVKIRKLYLVSKKGKNYVPSVPTWQNRGDELKLWSLKTTHVHVTSEYLLPFMLTVYH
jgi:hypothetical protein